MPLLPIVVAVTASLGVQNPKLPLSKSPLNGAQGWHRYKGQPHFMGLFIGGPAWGFEPQAARSARSIVYRYDAAFRMRRICANPKVSAQMPYWRLYYHVVWATKHREPVISDLLIEPIVRAIKQSAQESGVIVYTVGVMPEHIHVLAQVPPSVTLSSVIGQWKGASSHAANTYGPASPVKIAWQAGYGVHSVSQRAFEQVRDYVQNQRERHAAREVYGAYERTEDDPT